MQLKSLWVSEYKMLKDFRIEFDQPVSVLIGLNGSGKSSVLEVLAEIFTAVWRGQVEQRESTQPFNYKFEIEYQIDCRSILDRRGIAWQEGQQYFEVNIDNLSSKIRIAKQASFDDTDNHQFYARELLPSNIVLYYSGISSTLHRIIEDFEKRHEESLRKISVESDQSYTSFPDITGLPFLYFDETNYEILLACLFAFEYNKKLDGFFTNELKINNKNELTKIRISIKKREFQRGSGKKDFWGARGLVRQFLELLLEKSTNNDLMRVSEDYLLVSLRLPEWYAIRDFYGDERKLFYLLHILYTLNMLEWITVAFEKNDISVVSDGLSEGEKQLVSIRGLSELVIGENTVLLLDEPDVFLHPQLQQAFIESIEVEKSRANYIITTHSPILLSNLRHGNLFKMSGGQAQRIRGHYYGREYSHNLEDLMDTPPRNEEAQALLNTVFEHIDNEKFEEAKAAIDKAIALVGPDDPEIARANALLNYLED